MTAYTYDGAGQLLTETDPRGKVTRYAYDAKGNLSSVTNALGHVLTFGGYDANGRPHSVVDANRVETKLTYNFRGQVTSSATLGQ